MFIGLYIPFKHAVLYLFVPDVKAFVFFGGYLVINGAYLVLYPYYLGMLRS